MFQCPPKLSRKIGQFDPYNVYYQEVLKNPHWILEGTFTIYITEDCPLEKGDWDDLPYKILNKTNAVLEVIRLYIKYYGSDF